MNAPVLSLGLHTLLQTEYVAAHERVVTALKAAGFEIVAEIDLADMLAKKTEARIRPYKIIAVCNPDIARRVLTIAPQIGVVLPCNVAVAQLQDDQVEVRIADPISTWNLTPESYLRPIADDLNTRLERVLDALKR